MELINNGAKSVFTGHVQLIKEAYVLTADRMTRIESTGLVEAEGHIVGTWLKPTGEKTTATGEEARYNPQTQTTELWKDARLMHWESASDPQPLVVTAERFIAHHDEHSLEAQNDVTIRRAGMFESHSDAAKYLQNEEVIHLWGERKTTIQVVDAQGSGNFLSDRAQLYLSPRRARLIDQVTGHLIPASR
jgi:LPS export ABC transporter protein LptC